MDQMAGMTGTASVAGTGEARATDEATDRTPTTFCGGWNMGEASGYAHLIMPRVDNYPCLPFTWPRLFVLPSCAHISGGRRSRSRSCTCSRSRSRSPRGRLPRSPERHHYHDLDRARNRDHVRDESYSPVRHEGRKHDGGSGRLDSGGTDYHQTHADWICDQCDAVNFARRVHCFGCGVDRPRNARTMLTNNHRPGRGAENVKPVLIVKGLTEETHEGMLLDAFQPVSYTHLTLPTTPYV